MQTKLVFVLFQWLRHNPVPPCDPIPLAGNFKFTEDGGSQSLTTAAILIQVNPQLFPGAITPVSANIATNTSPGAISANPAHGGAVSTYSYQWQQSTDGISFTNISGATSLIYSPGNLSATTYYRRKVTCGTDVLYTNVSKVSVSASACDDINYVRERIILKPAITTSSAAAQLTALTDVRQTTQYLDGLGRPVQTVVKQGALISGGNASDLVNVMTYDAYGRDNISYLPFASSGVDGNFKCSPFKELSDFNLAMFPDEQFYYTQKDFEASPLNRPQSVYAAGNSWVGSNRSIDKHYWLNTTTDAVRIWTVTDVASNFGSYASTQTYDEGQLYKNATVEEKGTQTIEFKDKSGNVILKKVQLTAAADNGSGSGHSGWLCTYYIYDDWNNLRCMIQPRGVELISPNWVLTDATILAEQCFRYEYDARNRVIRKKIPGAGEVFMVYDARDRLVMTQDANLRTGGKWLVTKYDELNQPNESGLLTDGTTTFANHLANAYNSTSYPNTSSNYEELTKTFYDNYNWLTSNGNPFASQYNEGFNYFEPVSNTIWPYGQSNTQSNKMLGMITGTKTKIIGTSTYLYSINFYDSKGRVIQIQNKNITGGTDIATTQYTWSGQPLVTVQVQEKQSPNAQTTVIVSKLTYDALGRVTTIEKKQKNTQVNNNTMSEYKAIVQNEYNALGQLKKKSFGEAPLQTLTYDYNIRGWLLGMNRDYLSTEGQTSDGIKFGFELGYDKAINKTGRDFTGDGEFTGNIRGMVWKSDGDDTRRKYDFSYDNVNRLLKADFEQQNADNHLWDNNQVNYNVKMGDGSSATSAYDANGNIKRMQQWGLKIGGSSQIDDLTYNYMANSNKLLNVGDVFNDNQTKLGDFRVSALNPVQTKTTTTTDYSYDDNGNLVKDLNKDLVTSGGANGIQYNYLNLPSIITVKKDNNNNKGTINYTYDATGNKLKKVTVDNSTAGKTITTTTTYLNGFVYESKVTSPKNTPDDDYTDKFQFSGHEEGRIRALYNNGTNPNTLTGFAYDYFIKDHLGNVRMVLTEETNPASIYQAGMEDANRSFETQLFNNIAETVTSNNKPSGFDADNTNKNVSQLFSSSAGDKRIGPGIVLKVMAGDKFNAKVYGWYLPNGTNTATYSPATNIVTGLITALSGGLVNAGSKGTSTELSSPTGVLNNPLSSFLNDPTRPNNTSVPKAYLNWMVLDEEQFKLVEGNYSAVQIPAITGTMQKQLMQANNGNDIAILKNGYLYVYVSNESQGNVYFDDIRVEHTKGPLLEETHYYPFGLTMAGTSSKAAGSLTNKYKFGGKELQANEFSDNSGLEWLDYGARMYDNQIGRWYVNDPISEKYLNISPYTFSINNPLRYYDSNGMEVTEIEGGVRFTGSDAESAFLLLSQRTSNVYIKILRDQQKRNEINSDDKKASNGNWAVFAVKNFEKAALALRAFGDKTINNLIIANHGASSEDQSWFALSDNPLITSKKDAISTDDITAYNNRKEGNNLTSSDKNVDLLMSMGEKVANGGNMILVFCYTGKGESGKTTASQLSILTGQRFNIYLPKGLSTVRFFQYSTGLALKTSGSFYPSNSVSGWIITSSKDNVSSIFDIILSSSGEFPVRIINKNPE